MAERGIDEAAVVRLVARLAEAGVDSIGALGSAGNYAHCSANPGTTRFAFQRRALPESRAPGERAGDQDPHSADR